MNEPRLSADDLQCWKTWIRTAEVHSKTLRFARRIDVTKSFVDGALHDHSPSALMCSFGKDSLVMSHLISVETGHRLPLFCHRDDLDFPESMEWSQQYTTLYDFDTRFLSAPMSVREWLAKHAHELAALDDVHSHAAEMAKAAFYDVVERAAEPFDMVFLGLRKDESHGRMMNRCKRGLLYEKNHPLRGKQWVCTPLGDWSGLDVYAYGVSRGLEFQPFYKCISFMHRDEPWRVREAWWIPEANTRRYGGVAWLRRYYPSLYAQLCLWLPTSSSLT